MKTEIQTGAERTHLCQLIEHMHLAMLTTTNDSGELVSRPMAPLEMASDGSIWFFSNSQSAKVSQLQALNLAFTDADRGTYVSICGYGEIHTDHLRIKRLWTPAAKPWFPDGPESPNLCLIKVVPVAAEYWDAPHSKMVRMFAMAASVISGKPIGLGENDVLNKLSVDSFATANKPSGASGNHAAR
jgi:general stress protein 26